MNNGIVFLRIISGVFLVFAVIPYVAFAWSEATIDVGSVSYLILYSIVMMIIAFGLLKLKSWARWAAVAFLLAGFGQSFLGTIRDLKVMMVSGVGVTTVLLALAVDGLLLAGFAAPALWLTTRSKFLFNRKRNQE